MNFRVLYIIVILLTVVQSAAAEDYRFPVCGVKGLYSASYGEMRPNHFHGGVDIRTDGVEGKAVVAVADGYISRIAVAPTGYGLALYVTHPDKGTMSVYAHLSRIRKDVADYLVEARYARKQNRLNLFPAVDEFRVKQGDTIAYSGNSGSSFGPHLHFEMRDVKSGHTLNPVQMGVVRPNDTIAPRLLRLHYVVLDTICGATKSRIVRSYTPVKQEGGYVVSGDVKVESGGYFVLEVRDSRNGSSNRFGIYRAEMSVDEKPHFEYRIDRFAFVDTRHCNLASYYPLQREAKCEVLRLAQLYHSPDYLYNKSLTNGVVSIGEGERKSVDIRVEDECGNASSLRFTMCGVARREDALELQSDSLYICSTKPTYMSGEGYDIFIPRDALYEPERLDGKQVEGLKISDTTLIQLSPFYRIFAEDTPFNKAVKMNIAVDPSIELQPHICVAVVDEKGKARYLGGECRTDSVEVVFRRGGVMVAVADTLAPVITPRFKSGADMRGVRSISFAVKDNFSGIRSYRLSIDGEWRTVEYQPVKRVMEHRFDRALAYRGMHEVELEVVDNCGNRGVWRGKILK